MQDKRYQQFLLEKELSDRLSHFSLEERRAGYREIYSRFFDAYPEVAYNPGNDLTHKIDWQLSFLKPFLDKDTNFLEVGAGNCLLSCRISKMVANVIAYEVADSIPHIENKPENLILKTYDGIDFSEDDNSIDIVYSNDVIEHIHIDDTIHHLKQYYRILKGEGKVIIVTPSALTGPHDISRDYRKNPEGFHMKEYTYSDLRNLLKVVGFTKCKGYWGSKKSGYFPLNITFLILLEKLYRLLPSNIRYMLRKNTLLLKIFGLKIVGFK